MSDHETDKAEPQVGPKKPGDKDPRDDIEDAESRVARNPDRKAD